MYNTNTEIKEYLTSLVGNSPFGILSIDLTGCIAIINKTMVEILELQGNINTYLNKPVLDVIQGINIFSERIGMCINNRRKEFNIDQVAYKNKYLSIKGRIILNGMLITIQDITKLKKAENHLLERTKQLEKSNIELEQFAYISSHDLQEPIKTIISFVDLFSESYSNQLDEDGKQYLHFISEASNRISNQIKSLLKYSRIGYSKTKNEVDCNVLIKEVIQDLSSSIEENNIEIEVGRLPTLFVYEEDFKSLFQNLISNAIKFRKKNITPKIKINVEENSEVFKFAVYDNGIGIQKEYQKKIFVIFQRLHSRNKYDGTGIGLAQCKKIVELHDGDIWVKSEINTGSTFYFTINK